MGDAIAEPSRSAGLRRLKAFVPNAGTHYAKSRNFDFGPGRRDNVSLLSPYVRHRLVLEQELLETVLHRHSPTAAEAFVQEVFWRAYFKGWLEHRPDVWADYRMSVSDLFGKLDADSELLERYNTAVEGNTGNDWFDGWANELVTDGYLHNHARMWFASIWVFTLKLPWQLGADFFYRHLIDGDPAANTLGWRWVAGLHTRGKTYLARVSNIANFTDNRYSPKGQLATIAPPLTETRVFPIRPLRAPQVLKPNKRFGLLITEEDGCPTPLLSGEVPDTILGALATRKRSPVPVGTPAYEFAHGAVADAVERTTNSLGVSGEVSTSDDWETLLVDWATENRLTTIVTTYTPVGPVAELLAGVGQELERRGITVVQLRRQYDSVTWPHARRGYYKLKKQIPSLLERLDLVEGRDEIGSAAV